MKASDVRQAKTELRRRMRSIRDGLSPDVRGYASDLICRRLINQSIFVFSKHVFSYVSMGSEVDTRGIVKAALDRGKVISIPLTKWSNGRLVPTRIYSLNEVGVDESGIPAPVVRMPDRYIDPGEIDLTLVPGVAFDVEGNRLGYGAGFYDRFLAAAGNDIIACGLAFDCQVLTSGQIPVEGFDVRVSYLITESRFIDCRRS